MAVRLQNRENASLGFLSPKSISLALRVPGRPDVLIGLLDAGPPATLTDGRILIPPNRDEALVEFEIEAQADERVRVEIYHPDAMEDVTPKVVEGFFEAARSRHLPKPRTIKESAPPPAPPEGTLEGTPSPPMPTPTAPEWTDLIADEGYRRVVAILAERRSINEAELAEVLGSPRRVRAFARHYDDLVRLLPFEVEVLTVSGMKTYARKD